MDGQRATGDLVRTAVAVSSGAVTVEAVLEWLGDVIRPLRTARERSAGPAGAFTTTASKGTVEIRPTGALPAGRVLDFKASPELEAAVDARSAPDAWTRLQDSDAVATAFAQALAVELRENGKAQIGNLGAWSLGKLPDLTVFVRFRAHPTSSRMF